MNKHFGFDIETNFSSPFKEGAELVCASIVDRKHSFLVNYHPESCNVNVLQNKQSFKFFVERLQDPSYILCAHNAAFDITFWEGSYHKYKKSIFNNKDRKVKCQIFDTMIADFLLSPDKLSYTLESVALRYEVGEKIKLEQDIKNSINIPLEDLKKYNKQDAKLCYLLYPILFKKLKENNQIELFTWLMKILQSFIDIQIRGVTVDINELFKKTEEYKLKVKKLSVDLKKRLGDILLTSPQQVAEVLYSEHGLHLPVVEYTGTNKPSTGADALSILKVNKQVSKKDKNTLEKILEFRKANKLLSTYFTPFKEKYLCSDGRIHSHYFIAKGSDPWYSTFGTVTGRSSSKDPNLQNIPQSARSILCADLGYKLFQADHSQLELRVAAYLSEDRNMLDAFRSKYDIHSFSTAKIYGAKYEEVLKKVKSDNKEWIERRRIIKTFNFAMIYGANWFTLKKILLSELGLDIPDTEIRKFIRLWENLYESFTLWKKYVHGIIKETGKITTDLRRRRKFFELKAKDFYDWKTHAQFQREGLNDLIQSMANDINFLGLHFLDQAFLNKDAYILLTVHDSIDGQYKNIPQKVMTSLIRRNLINKPMEVLKNDFNLTDLDNLILDVEIKLGEKNWS